MGLQLFPPYSTLTCGSSVMGKVDLILVRNVFFIFNFYSINYVESLLPHVNWIMWFPFPHRIVTPLVTIYPQGQRRPSKPSRHRHIALCYHSLNGQSPSLYVQTWPRLSRAVGLSGMIFFLLYNFEWGDIKYFFRL